MFNLLVEAIELFWETAEWNNTKPDPILSFLQNCMFGLILGCCIGLIYCEYFVSGIDPPLTQYYHAVANELTYSTLK